MNYTKFEIAAHTLTQEKSECGCVKSVTARIVLVDEQKFMRAVLAVGEPAPTFDESVESALKQLDLTGRDAADLAGRRDRI